MDLTAYYFCNKSSIIDIRLGSIQTSENIEINFQSEAKVEQNIAIVTTRSVYCYLYFQINREL